MDDATSQPSLKSKILSSDSLALGVLTFLGTSVAYLFEAGYLLFYGLPTWLIEINATRIITACTMVAVAISVLLFLLNSVMGLLAGNHPVQRALIAPFVNIAFISAFVFVTPIGGKWWFLGAYSLLLLVVTFLPPWFLKADGGSYLSRLGESAEQELEDKAAKQTGLHRFTGNLSVIFLVCLLLAGMGGKVAREKESHFVLASDPNMVLVNIYGATAVLVEYDPKTNQLSRSMRLEQMSGSLTFEKIKTGPLIRWSE